MRILFLSSIFPRPTAPTAGPFSYSLCQALANRHEVSVLAPLAWTERILSTSGRGTTTEPELEPFCTKRTTYFYPPKVLRSLYGAFMWVSIRSQVRRIMREFKPDCVLSYWLHPDGEAAIRAAHMGNIPCAVMVGGSDARLLPHDARRREKIKNVLAQADALITVSRGLKDCIADLGAPVAKVRAIYQGIDSARFYPGDKLAARERLGIPLHKRVLVWVGRMVEVKCLHVLLDAVAHLARVRSDVHVCLVGGGPLRPALESQAAALGITESVSFVGPQPQERLPDWYRAADLTVLSSRSEGIPNVLRESLACGTPFVATRVGDIAEFCPETAGDLVPPGDPCALAVVLERALAGQGQHQSLPRPASWEECADEIAELLQDLTASRKARGRSQNASVTAC